MTADHYEITPAGLAALVAVDDKVVASITFPGAEEPSVVRRRGQTLFLDNWPIDPDGINSYAAVVATLRNVAETLANGQRLAKAKREDVVFDAETTLAILPNAGDKNAIILPFPLDLSAL